METQDQLTAHHAKCFLITCMDFRLIDDVTHFMDKNGYNNNYDQFILAGASLGLTQTKFPHWGQTLLDHMGIGLNLHEFRQIIVIDHQDCGAYKKFYELSSIHEETQKHQHHLQMAYEKLSQKFPKFQFTGYLMNLHGQCQKVTIDQSKNKYVEHNITEEESFLSQIQHVGEGKHLTQDTQQTQKTNELKPALQI